MSTLPKNALVQAFLTDHKQFMRLLNETAEALASRDLAAARAKASELDSVAGPHIAFEEAVLYPALDDRTHERTFVVKLYDEHQQIIESVAELIANESLTDERMDYLHKELAKGLEHADHCGTLISNLSAMDESEQSDALDELQQLRGRKIKWTELKKDC